MPQKRSVNDYVSDNGFVANDGSDSAPEQTKKAKRSKTSSQTDRHHAKQNTNRSSHGNKAASPTKQDENGDDYWELNANGSRRVTLSRFSGKMLVNVREYYEADGQRKPGKKGISLSVDQFSTMLEVLPQIEEALRRKGETVPRPKYDGDLRRRDEDEEGGDEDDADMATSDVKGKRQNFEATSDEDED